MKVSHLEAVGQLWVPEPFDRRAEHVDLADCVAFPRCLVRLTPISRSSVPKVEEPEMAPPSQNQG